MLRMLKDHLASWRHSAHTATIACGSKVIDGRTGKATPRLIEERTMSTRASRKILVEKNLYAAFLSKRELEQSAFVAFLPKNGLHHPSRRFARTLERRASGRAVQ
jgi:hypothetical protein